MSPSSPREAECVGGPLAGTRLPADVTVYNVWKPPSEQVLDFVYPEHVEPPPGCVLLGTYSVQSGAANRGRLIWRAADL